MRRNQPKLYQGNQIFKIIFSDGLIRPKDLVHRVTATVGVVHCLNHLDYCITIIIFQVLAKTPAKILGEDLNVDVRFLVTKSAPLIHWIAFVSLIYMLSRKMNYVKNIVKHFKFITS